MTPVSIVQYVPNLDLLTPTDGRYGALLQRVAGGFAKPGATSGAATLDDPWDPVDVFVGGVGLTYDVNGQLTGGTITTISLLSSQGTVLAQLANAVPGGLALDAGALRAARGVPEALDALVAHWEIAFTATGVAAPGATAAGGVTFEGARNADTLSGTAWGDDLSGAAGNDLVQGLGGDDVLHGDRTLHLAADAPVGDDRLEGGAGHDRLYGNAGRDHLIGGDGDDHLLGDDWDSPGADDLLDGGAGRDLFWAEAGNDAYAGGAGRDRLTVSSVPAGGLFVADLAAGRLSGFGLDTASGLEIVDGSYELANDLRGGAAAESLAGGWLSDTLRGGGARDRLWGDWGDDGLSGDAGNDLLCGDAGLDALWGGAGADQFYFTDAGGDRIGDFLASDDQIWLAKGLVPGLASGVLAAAAFKDLGLGTPDADDRVLYERASGRLWVDADGSGAAARQLLAQLDPGTALSAADIEVKPLWDRDDFLV